MTAMTTLWTVLALIVSILFLVAVVRWDRRPGPSTGVDVTPIRPPADAEAEGMRVAEPGGVAPGPEQDSG